MYAHSAYDLNAHVSFLKMTQCKKKNMNVMLAFGAVETAPNANITGVSQSHPLSQLYFKTLLSDFMQSSLYNKLFPIPNKGHFQENL